MSHILSALRKSEAERIKGKVPRVTTQHEPVAPRRGRIWPLIAVGALAFNAALVGFVLWQPLFLSWWGGQRAVAVGQVESRVAADSSHRIEPPAEPPAVTLEPVAEDLVRQASTAAGQDGSVATHNGSAEADGQASSEASAIPAQSAGAEDPVLAPAAAPAETAPAAVSTDGSGAATRPASGQIRIAEPEAPPKPRQPNPAEIATTTPAIPEAAPKAEPARTQLARAVTLPEPEPAAEAPPQGSDSHIDVPELWRMPRTFRSKVPEFSIMVHVYAPEQTDRFVIIDRKKYREGDWLEGGVLVDTILPNGVVFELQGQQFKLISG